ncbi:MAG: hypothetical protein K8M05_28805 [Deltaproteobacteria bacterium]|nr:hypothetical protein [Kofleriaceae bacterium]
MERDDEHKKWVWKHEREPDRPDKDEDGRATARDVVDDDDTPGSDEASPLVSLWRSALEAVEGAAGRAHELKEHELDELEVLQLAWRTPRTDDGEPN